MTNESALRLASLVAQWSILSCAVLAVCWVSTFAVRKNASLRHLIWLLGLAGTLLAPLVSISLPSRNVIQASSAISEPLAASELTATEINSLALETLPPVPSKEEIPWTVPFWLWMAGVALVVAQGGIAGLAIRKLRKQSVSWLGEEIDPPALALRLGVRKSWQLRQSSTEKPPAALTWGFVQPTVLLPRDTDTWTVQRLRATVLHELAHIRRADSLTQRFALAACALHWFNPLVWLAARALRADAEAAADDAVIRSGIKPSDYAAELLGLAAELGNLRQPAFSQGVSIMKDSRIETRIRAIVDPSRRRRGITTLQTMAATTVGLFVLAGLGAICPTVAVASPATDPAIGGTVYQAAKEATTVTIEDKPKFETRVDAVLVTTPDAKPLHEKRFQTTLDLKAQVARLEAQLAESRAQLAALKQILLAQDRKRQADKELYAADMARKTSGAVKRVSDAIRARELALAKQNTQAVNLAQLAEVRRELELAKANIKEDSEAQRQRVESLIVQERQAADRAAGIKDIAEVKKDAEARSQDVYLIETQIQSAEDAQKATEREKMLIQQKRAAELIAQATATQKIMMERQAAMNRQMVSAKAAFERAQRQQIQAAKARMAEQVLRERKYQKAAAEAKAAKALALKKQQEAERARKLAAEKAKKH